VSIDAGYEALLSSSTGGNAAAAAAHFMPRLQLVEHSTVPIRALHSSRRDVLLLDINLQQLMQQLEAHTRQQQQHQRITSRQRQQQQQHSGGRSSLSIDGDSWLPSGAISRPGSFDLGSLPGGMESAAVSPHAYAAAGAAAAAAAGDASLSRQGSGHSWHSQLSGIAEGSCRTGGNFPQQQQQQQLGGAALQQRRQLAPAVALALQALCVLHRWGCDSQLDDQLAAMLLEAGLAAAAPLVQQQQQPSAVPVGWSARPSVDEHNCIAAAVSGGEVCSSSRGTSPSGPEQAAAGASLLMCATTTPAAAAGKQLQAQHQQTSPHVLHTAPAANSSSSSSSGELQQEQLLLHQLAQLLQDAPRSGPQLLRCCPCLSQEVLLSSNGGMVLSLPAARAGVVEEMQQQQQVAPSGVLLRATPSLLSCR
jgi:hypothetical protein